MQNLGGAAILMPQNSEFEYIVGDAMVESSIENVAVLPIFSEEAISFLGCISKNIFACKGAQKYSDVVTFGFWCRKASLYNLRESYADMTNAIGRGVIFHIAPSNVAVNFAYSCAVALLAGNASIVRLPSKKFTQVDIICQAVRQALEEMPMMRSYLLFVRYGHEKAINDKYSVMCDMRVIWGGDNTIQNIRQSPINSRAFEIVFADRYSLALIDADKYLIQREKRRLAQDFYNDTYLTDQNACTSPCILVWLGNRVGEAQSSFWENLYQYIENKYELRPIQSVDKLVALYRMSITEDCSLIKTKDNLITRIQVNKLSKKLMNYKMNSGFFMEYQAKKIEEIIPLCDTRCQTIAYYGVEVGELKKIMGEKRPRGVDRIVPIGRTMDFDLIWDGYDLIHCMSRIFSIKK